MSDFFFDKYPLFYKSTVYATPSRLHLRYMAVIRNHLKQIEGKRILDIGAHDGRWSCAALQAGAAHVTVLEPRSKSMAMAKRNLSEYLSNPDSYSFIEDTHEVLATLQAGDYDTIFCLGFLYHIPDLYTTIKAIAALKPKQMIVDCSLAAGKDCLIRYFQESKHGPACGVTGLVSRPTKLALKTILKHHGFGWQAYDWRPIKKTKDMKDYIDGLRITGLCKNLNQ